MGELCRSGQGTSTIACCHEYSTLQGSEKTSRQESELTPLDELDAVMEDDAAKRDFIRMGQRAQTPAITQEPTDIEQEIQARARKIRAMPLGERIYAQGSIMGRIKTMERNIAKGYHEYIPQLEAERRVLELSKLGMI
jgi:hypothetical protein